MEIAYHHIKIVEIIKNREIIITVNNDVIKGSSDMAPIIQTNKNINIIEKTSAFE